jgi:tetratricopeptide (TPR) repeat protein
MLHRGWLLTALGQVKEGLTLLAKGLAAVRDTGAVMSTPYALIMLAEAQIGLGKLIDSRNCLAEAARIIDTTEERCNEAELYRLLGNLLSATGDQAAAEQNFHRALAVAARQSAKALEARAAPVSLVSGVIRAGVAKPTVCSPRSTAGSPKALIRLFCKKPKHCLTRWNHEARIRTSRGVPRPL